MTQLYNSIRNIILYFDPTIGAMYSELCHKFNPGYRSISEADWAFCRIVAVCIPPTYRHKYQILKYFFQKDRPDRAKKNRTDYVELTIRKALNHSAQHRANPKNFGYSSDSVTMKVSPVSNKYSAGQRKWLSDLTLKTKGKKLISKSGLQKNYNVDKNSVLKICNTMKIFHFGRPVKNIEYYNKKSDNYLRATIPYSLNQTDLRYYMELLFQYVDSVKKVEDISLAKDKFFPINIKLILKNSGLASNGSGHYQRFLKSLNKLSDITLEYNKKISLNDARCIEKEALLSYRLAYKKENQMKQSSDSTVYKKLVIKMHPIVLDMIKEATYNYALFNKISYDCLTSDKMKLLYYYFCCLTTPGGNSVTLSLEELLILWPKSSVKKTIRARKQKLAQLLQEFISLQSKIYDLDLTLIFANNQITGVKVKKRCLMLI